jgi:ribosomal protein S12 methylthiotransferase accessory factor
MRIIQRIHRDPSSGMVSKIDLEIQVPPAFPEKYLPSLVRSAELCAVKKHLERPPKFEVYTSLKLQGD